MRIPITQELFAILTVALAVIPTGVSATPQPNANSEASGAYTYQHKKTYNHNVYLIRHGEKPANKSDTNLSSQGIERSYCIADLFSKSPYNIGKIIAQTPKKSGSRSRPLKTVTPLAETLDMNVDTSCDRDDAKCVKKLVDGYKGDGDVLICWEHAALTDIAAQLGVKNAEYPSSHFDLIWNIQNGKMDEGSEHCEGIDTVGKIQYGAQTTEQDPGKGCASGNDCS